jgi:hypothetical protein
MADALLELSDRVEHLIDDAQADHLNGYPQSAQAKLRQAIDLLDRLAFPRKDNDA